MIARPLAGILLAAALLAACSGDSLDENGITTNCRPEENAPARVAGDTFITDGGVDVQVTTSPFEPNPAQAGDSVTAHYTGTLEDGSQFDDSRERGAPFTFVIGTDNVICGWVEGVVGMSPGEVRVLTIPPELAYGTAGFGAIIPPDATLSFEIEMIEFGEPAP